MSKSKIAKSVKEYFLIAVGMAIYTLGWTIFLTPNNLVGGGVTGVSSIIQYATGIKMGYSYLVINVFLLLISFLVIGPMFGAKTIYAIILASIGLNVFQVIVPQSIIQDFALSNGKLMCAIIGGIMTGVGIGISISQGGSSGGTDIIALIVAKYRNISPGRMILWMDVIIILSSLLVPSRMPDGSLMKFDTKFVTVIYGLILVTINGTVVDLYLSGSRQSVQLFIFSRHYADIADMIARDFHRGVTVLDGEGWYTKENIKVLTVVTRKTDVNLILRSIKAIDNDAFLSISSVTGVYGRGFDSIKGNVSKKN
ncbi:MAG: YitT family protein [Bacteroidales bacterium]|nr:YitT family protein [Bacteroidales bacterium]MEE3389572.1 YitT family protein [Candidatus Cryptobacteroides sp.]MCH3941984.1 YitT family protein [Bacteroidales bacterium]MCI2108452.1 YitT family protein [Bacteroidales bacterium]MDY6319776.1 YitT family protein [Bacteroidales bacterium]